MDEEVQWGKQLQREIDRSRLSELGCGPLTNSCIFLFSVFYFLLGAGQHNLQFKIRCPLNPPGATADTNTTKAINEFQQSYYKVFIPSFILLLRKMQFCDVFSKFSLGNFLPLKKFVANLKAQEIMNSLDGLLWGASCQIRTSFIGCMSFTSRIFIIPVGIAIALATKVFWKFMMAPSSRRLNRD